MMTAAFLFLLFIAGVALNAFFAGYETGFVASNPIRVRYLADQEGQSNAKRLLAYLERPDRMITVVLLGTNLALVMGTLAATRLFGPFWAGIIATPMFLIFAEVVPKSMFRIHPTRLALRLFPVIRFFDGILAPIALPVTWISQGFVRLMAAEQRDIRTVMTSADDVRVLVDESADQGTIEPEEQEMIHAVMSLQKTTAREIMVPRIDIKALSETATRTELVSLLRDSGFTRIPVFEEHVDQIKGVISAFDVLADTNPEESDIRRFVQPVMHVPDTMKLDDVLAMMREKKQRMAVVTDEFGGTDGLITLEDILEEIFGEIHDEHDRGGVNIRKVGERAYILDARLTLEDANEEMGVFLEDPNVETVGGWLMHAVGRIPEQGEVIEHGPYQVMILEAGASHVSRIRLEFTPEAESATTQEENPPF
jgi:putative hemolysin